MMRIAIEESCADPTWSEMMRTNIGLLSCSVESRGAEGADSSARKGLHDAVMATENICTDEGWKKALRFEESSDTSSRVVY